MWTHTARLVPMSAVSGNSLHGTLSCKLCVFDLQQTVRRLGETMTCYKVYCRRHDGQCSGRVGRRPRNSLIGTTQQPSNIYSVVPIRIFGCRHMTDSCDWGV